MANTKDNSITKKVMMNKMFSVTEFSLGTLSSMIKGCKLTGTGVGKLSSGMVKIK
eukprot:Awhi_evm1s10885